MSRLELCLLGTPELCLEGKRLLLPTRKLLALVAYLALEGPTSRARLASLFWSEADEESARGNLRRELNRLRHTPLAQELKSERERLWLAEAEIDVAHFRARLREGRLKEALALWQGPLLAGLELAGAGGFEEWLQAERARLEEARHGALIQYAEGLEASGELRGALAARLELLLEDELQELHHREVMRLLYQIGEREAALERYERLKGLLQRELGLEPLPETRKLAERIRAAQVPLEPPPPPSPAAQVRLHPPLIGREREWQLLESARQSWMSVFVSGEPGVGKTRLMQEFAAYTGLPVAFNRGSPGDAGIPYATAARFIRSVLAQGPGLRLAPWARRELARLVPELEDAEIPPIQTPEQRLRLYEAYCAFAQTQTVFLEPFVTLVDDLQFFDSASNEMFAFETARAIERGARRLTLVAFRKDELSPELLRPMRAHIEAGMGIWIDLEPLSETDLLHLVRSLSGSSSAVRFTKRLYKATGGNPLFVLETLKALFEAGELQAGAEGWSTPYDRDTTDYHELPIPTSVREAATRRLNNLGEATRRLLEAASLVGDSFMLEELEGATALSEWESVGVLERTLQAGLIEREEARYRFHHELVRRSIAEGLSPERKSLLHLKLASNLERLGAPPARIAEHYEQGGSPQAAILWRIRAALAAARVYAHAKALEHYAKALLDGPDEDEAYRIRRERIRLWAILDEREAWAQEIEVLSDLASRLGQPSLEAEAALEWAAFDNASGHYAEALGRAEGVLRQPGLPPALSTRAQHQAGIALLSLGRLTEAEPRLRAALEAGPSSDPQALIQRGQIHMALCNCAMQRGALEEAERHTQAALELYRQAGHQRGEVEARSRQGLLAGLQGDTQGAIRTLEQAREEAQEIGERVLERVILLSLFKFQFESGDLEAALPNLERGLALAREPQDPRLEGIFLNNLGVVYRARGELGKALESFSRALESAETIGSAQHQVRRRLTLAENHLDLGSPERARPLIEAARELAEAGGLHEVQAWLLALLARCDLMEGHPEQVPSRLEPLLAANLADHNDHDRAAWLLGEAWLRLGEPRRALEAVRGRPALPAFRVRLLAVEIAAKEALGEGLEKDLQTAAEVLADSGVATLESFELCRILIRALQAAGQPEKARRLSQDSSRRLTQMVATLDGRPDLQQNFHKLYRDLLG